LTNAVMPVVRVVLVDDSDEVVRELESLVGSIPGVEIVGSAADGEAAINAVRTIRPDLMVLDVSMPRMNGFGVLAALKGMECRPIVLMLSNTSAPAVKKRALAAGADGYFDKSREIAALLEEIRRRSEPQS
jgi:DNA-binding NarL/FixJ family response regulator